MPMDSTVSMPNQSEIVLPELKLLVGNRGYFIQPTVFADVQYEMKIAQEEIFGPIENEAPIRKPGPNRKTDRAVILPCDLQADPRQNTCASLKLRSAVESEKTRPLVSPDGVLAGHNAENSLPKEALISISMTRRPNCRAATRRFLCRGGGSK
jgi:hypothetical protein